MCSLKLCWIILLVYAGSKPSPADGMFSSSCHPWSLGFRPSCHCASCCPVKQKLRISVLAGPTILTVIFLEEHVCDHLAIAIWEHSEWKTAPLAWTLAFDKRLNNVGKHEFNALETLGFVARYGIDMEIQWATCWKPDDSSFWVWHSVNGIHWNFAKCRIAVLSGTLAAIQVSNNVGLHHLKKYPFPPSIRSISLWSSCLFVGGWFREGKIHLVFPL